METALQWIVEHYMEIAASVFGGLNVWLTIKQKIWSWPVGLAYALFSLFVFFFSKLYAGAILQCFYLAMTIFGWYQWMHGGENKSKLRIRRIRINETFLIISLGACASLIAGTLLRNYTDAALPEWDSLVAVFGVIATWAQAKKIMEHWIMWIIIDSICTGMYLYQELYFFTALYFAFVILAVYGFITWKKDFKKQTISVA